MLIVFHYSKAVKIANCSLHFFAVLMCSTMPSVQEFTPVVFTFSQDQLAASLVPGNAQKQLEVNKTQKVFHSSKTVKIVTGSCERDCK